MLGNPSPTRGLLLLALLSATILGSCRAQVQDEAASEIQEVEEEPLQQLPIVEPPFNRSRLLLAVVRAASAHSAGLDDSSAQRILDGKQFEVRLRFGCDNEDATEGQGWTVDRDGEALRLKVAPTITRGDAVSLGLADDDVEALEGFWLKRPWALQAGCPAPAPAADNELRNDSTKSDDGDAPIGEPAVAVQRIGIAEFFSAEDSRTRQRTGRPFQAVRQMEEGARVGRQGFDLVLAGRFRARSGGRVILCAGSGRDRPPDCVVSASIDRVWIEDPDDGKVIAEWTV